MADRKTIEHCMTFELLTIKDFSSYFGDGYCVEMPSDKTKLNNLLNYLSAQKAVWKLYVTLINSNWFHGIHIIFPKDKDTDSAMLHICELLGTYSYCVIESGTQTVVDTNGDVISFADFTEMYD